MPARFATASCKQSGGSIDLAMNIKRLFKGVVLVYFAILSAILDSSIDSFIDNLGHLLFENYIPLPYAMIISILLSIIGIKLIWSDIRKFYNL